MNKIILITLFLFVCSGLQAQTNLDSLFGIWQDESQSDSAQVAAYNGYIWKGFLFSNPDSAYILASEMIEFSKKNKYSEGESLGFNLQGVSWHIKGDYPKAIDYYERSVKISEEIGDKLGIANTLGNIGNVYHEQGDDPKALDYQKRALKSHKEIGDKLGIANSLISIGIVYHEQGDGPKTLDYYERGLKIYKEIGHKRGIALALMNIGIIYSNQGDYPKALDNYERALKINEEIGNKRGIANTLINMGNDYRDQGDYPKALDYFERALKINEEIGSKQAIALAMRNIGYVYYSQDDAPKALDYYERALKINEEIGNKYGIASNLIGMGNSYRKQGYYPKALGYCKRGLVIAETLGSLSLQENACQCLYGAYKSMGNVNEALFYHEKSMVFEKSLKKEETVKKLQQMEFQKQILKDSLKQEKEKLKVEMAHKEEVMKKDKTRNILFGAGFILLLLAGGFLSRWRYVKKSNKRLSYEKDRSENLLLNILPVEIAEELKLKGSADARDFEQVSILFTDFKGFTQISMKLSAKELVEEINHYFKAFDFICERYGVEKIKTIGDSYMVAGGLPVPKEDSVKNTVLAALAMSAFVKNRKAEREAAGQIPFEMRTGIHTGNVVAGIVGVKKFQYDIWGDTVNTASRMESNGEVGQVNISEHTYELLKNDPDFVFESRGKIMAKGKGEIEMYFVRRT